VIGIGVIGYGYWGPNLVRNFLEVPDTKLVAVCDVDPERLALVTARCPGVKVITQVNELFADPEIDALALATPVSSHFDLAMGALRAGKHVLVEKPMTVTSCQAARLIDEAARLRKVLMVDHTFLYAPAVTKISEILGRGDLGDLYYYDSVRVNLGLFRHDVSVLWDLAVHDVAVMDYLLPVPPVAVSACGMTHLPGQTENLAYLTFFFDGNLIAHIHVNWLAPVKLRRTVIGGSRKMIIYDDLEASEKVKVYDKGLVLTEAPEMIHRMLVGYRSGDMWAPCLDTTEALRTEVLHFVRCLTTGERPISDGHAGLRVVRLLEAAARSMAERGRPVDLANFKVPA
jgi:predicted dehydrogenase